MPTDYTTARQRDYGRVRDNLARHDVDVTRFPESAPTRKEAGELFELATTIVHDRRRELGGDDLAASVDRLRDRLSGWPAPDEPPEEQ